MTLHKKDERSEKIIFLANCLLNANNKVREFARYKGIFSEVLKAIDAHGLGVIQMPCPETLYMGNQRWWNSRNLYDTAGYRRYCRKLSEQMVDYLENYHIMQYDVIAVLTCDGSPSCGIKHSSFCEDWGGRPKEIPRILIEQPGIYMEEFIKECRERKVECPEIYGLPMDDREKGREEIIKDFEQFIIKKL